MAAFCPQTSVAIHHHSLMNGVVDVQPTCQKTRMSLMASQSIPDLEANTTCLEWTFMQVQLHTQQ
jgi:hypothetical protein